MANATVEKIKDLGLRHGEKVVVGLAAAVCLVFAWQAFSRPTIDLTPEQIEQVAKRAASNINADAGCQGDRREARGRGDDESRLRGDRRPPGAISPEGGPYQGRQPLDHPRAGRGADPRAARPGRTGEPLRLSRPRRCPGLRPRRAGQADPRGSGDGRSRRGLSRQAVPTRRSGQAMPGDGRMAGMAGHGRDGRGGPDPRAGGRGEEALRGREEEAPAEARRRGGRCGEGEARGRDEGARGEPDPQEGGRSRGSAGW